MLSPDHIERFGRQLILPELGRQGQERLAAARVMVVGCGGLGAPVLHYLAAAGVGRLTLFDDDAVEISNLNRQVIHRRADVGRFKAERAREWVLELDPAAEVDARVERIATENCRDLVRAHDLVIDCTDGLAGKYLLNDAAVLEDRPLVHGAATALAGQVLVVRGRRGPCLRCAFGSIPPAGAVPTCQEAGILGATCGVVGSIMAGEAIKLLARVVPVHPRLLRVDLYAPEVRPVALARRADCPACGDDPRVDARNAEDYRAPRDCAVGAVQEGV